MPYRYAPEPFVDPPLGMAGGMPRAIGGGRPFGTRVPMRANTDPLRQAGCRVARTELGADRTGPRDQVFCTKVGASRPDEMYIVSAHMDGQGWGDAANDNASGTALVLELARVFSAADIRTERSIRFACGTTRRPTTAAHAPTSRSDTRLQGREDLRAPAAIRTEMARTHPARHAALRSRDAAR